MFPAGAGMNRKSFVSDASGWNVPRRRGDEPDTVDNLTNFLLCSPQARG